MKITEYIKDNVLLLDGGMGTLLQEKGLAAGEMPERWCISHPDVVRGIHRAYFDAGSNVVNTNTFGASSLKFSDGELREIVFAAVDCARKAAEESQGRQPKWVALDVGPTGKMLSPLGDLAFEDAVEIFSKTVKLGAEAGADLVYIETMNDSYECRAALLAAKESCDLPVFVSAAFGVDGKLMTGADAPAMIAMLEGLGADAIGINCSLGPRELREVAEKHLEYSSTPVIFKPNAGLPRVENGRTVYDVTPEEFADEVIDLARHGVRAVGGCCGTTPAHIAALAALAGGVSCEPITDKGITMVSSYTHAVTFGERPILIGERINPSGKKLLREALRREDIDYILREALSQEESGAHILDVNVGLPEIDEKKTLCRVVREIQAVCDLPLQIDTSDASAMEAALRIYNGKPMINSVNGKEESMREVFPLAKKYGGLVVALTLDEGGIPDTAEGRLAIAKKILKTAEEYGISKKDVIFDPLALTVSADSQAAEVTLRSIELIKRETGALTSLGVSNVSFGLPERELVSSAFFTLALGKGLDAAIINPLSREMKKAYYCYLALSGKDASCAEYIEYASSLPKLTEAVGVSVLQKDEQSFSSELARAIVKGLRREAAEACEALLATQEPLDVVNGEIIPALNTVGEGFEKKTVYLPALLMSAEAAGAAFEKIKQRIPAGSGTGESFVIATVKGDIHDIGKNIVKLLLENYGFAVTDLGRDVPPETILDAVKRTGAKLLGLSALMTTTVPSMQATIELVKREVPDCKIIVGGAVLNKEYADSIGADKYAKDAMETVRYARTR